MDTKHRHELRHTRKTHPFSLVPTHPSSKNSFRRRLGSWNHATDSNLHAPNACSMSAGNAKEKNDNNGFFGRQKLLMHPPQGGWCVKVAQTFGRDFCNVKNGATQYCKENAEN
jgi:hypothetical protein